MTEKNCTPVYAGATCSARFPRQQQTALDQTVNTSASQTMDDTRRTRIYVCTTVANVANRTAHSVVGPEPCGGGPDIFYVVYLLLILL